MSKLTAEERKKLADRDFAIQEQRRYPTHDRAHGANALARVTQHGSPDEKKKVRANVCDKYPDLPSCKNKQYENPLN